jgi:predicted unusual protein kinase regulating ubiquinone biosynthesis (AarF/ABC1/UbiB family)
MADEGSTIIGELRRFARTSGAVGGIAARVAGERVFGVRTNRASHAEDLKTILGGLKGPLMKVAQFLSTVPDALPAEYAAELAQLQANAPPMGWAFVRRRMSNELGPDWEKRFASFSHEAAAAASLGQVHRATLPSGEDVACKLQYPDMASTVEADLPAHGRRDRPGGNLQGANRAAARGAGLRPRGGADAAVRVDARG